MLPRIAISDPDDARVVFDALNAYYAHDYDRMSPETKARVIDMLMAAHAETVNAEHTAYDFDPRHNEETS